MRSARRNSCPRANCTHNRIHNSERGYSAELSQKVKRGIRESYEKGYFIGGFGLFGYDIIDKHWVINETEAAVVREIFERYRYGEKAKSIVSWLDSIGVRNKRGKPFTVNALAKLIRNTKYKGIVEYDDRILTNVTPAIVDEKTWNDCNRILDNQRHKQKCIQKHSEYILSGKLFCRQLRNVDDRRRRYEPDGQTISLL